MVPDRRIDSFEFSDPQPNGRTVTFLLDDLFLVAAFGGIPAFGACPVWPDDRHVCIRTLHHLWWRGPAGCGQQEAIKYDHTSSLTERGFRKVAPWFILEASAAQLPDRRHSSGFIFRSNAMGSSDASSAARSSSVVGMHSSLGLVQGLRLLGASSSADRLMSYSRRRRPLKKPSFADSTSKPTSPGRICSNFRMG